MRIPNSEVKMVERLLHEYGLPNDVINVLLVYVMCIHHYRLPRPIVEKVAGYWKRHCIVTVEQAYEQVRRDLRWDLNPEEKIGKFILMLEAISKFDPRTKK